MRHLSVCAVALATSFTLPFIATAGPPLICHPFDIGTAQSLPIGPADGGWSSVAASCDRTRLIGDTLALLTPATPTLVRMETLRRATMYVADDRAAADRLLQALRARTSSSPATRAEARALFDVGYLVETYRQLSRLKPGLAAAAGHLDGYNLLTGVMRVVKDDPALHFAAALMTVDGKHATAHSTHAQQARAAAGDALLAKNVRTHL